MTITVTLPLSLKNPLNGSREHWAVKAKRAKSQRAAVTLVLKTNEVRPSMNPVRACPRCTGTGELGYGGPTCADCEGTGQRGMVVTMTRVYAGRSKAMDDDGLSAALKHVRDSVAAYLGVDDADPRVTFRCAQERGPKASKAAVKICFEVVAPTIDETFAKVARILEAHT